MYKQKASSLRPLFYVPQGCPDIFPGNDIAPPPSPLLMTENYFYCAIADGEKLIFTDHDGLPEYHSSPIFDPRQVSLINLYINGMIQPPVLYEVSKGLLRLKTADAPRKEVSIVLQFIRLFLPT